MELAYFIVLVMLILFLLSRIVHVPAGKIAIVKTVFLREPKIIRHGKHVIIPLIQSVVRNHKGSVYYMDSDPMTVHRSTTAVCNGKSYYVTFCYDYFISDPRAHATVLLETDFDIDPVTGFIGNKIQDVMNTHQMVTLERLSDRLNKTENLPGGITVSNVKVKKIFYLIDRDNSAEILSLLNTLDTLNITESPMKLLGMNIASIARSLVEGSMTKSEMPVTLSFSIGAATMTYNMPS